MTTPTLPQAAQIALDALVLSSTDASRINPHQQHVDAAITALREALAQPAAPAVPDGMVPPFDFSEWHGNLMMLADAYWEASAAARHRYREQLRAHALNAGQHWKARAMIAATPQAVPAPADIEELRHVANEWADMATSMVVWLRNIADGTSTPEAALENAERCLAHCRKVNDTSQALGKAIAAAPAPAVREPQPQPDARKLCTCDGAGRGPGRACVVQAGGRLGDLWKCAKYAAPAVPDGMVLVPREPSDKQISAGNALSWPFPSGPTYRAMIAAAPTPQAVPAPAVREPQSQEWIVSRNPAPHAAAPMVPSESRTFTFGAEPVVREPLTTDRIAELWVDILLTTPPNGIHEEEGLPWARLARAVEKEHNIGITGGGK